jgi:GMP synthase-like glutamine amidotransferase
VGVCPVTLTAQGRDSALFLDFPGSFPTLQWHGAAVLRAPDQALVLAQNAHCPIQAMQIGPRAFGIQYHVELIDTTVSDWGAIPEYRCALESITGPGGQERLEAAVAENMDGFRTSAGSLYRNFRSVLK